MTTYVQYIADTGNIIGKLVNYGMDAPIMPDGQDYLIVPDGTSIRGMQVDIANQTLIPIPS